MEPRKHWRVNQRVPEPRVLYSAKDVGPHIPAVRRLADENRASFGFLPADAYVGAAAKGRLWVALAESDEAKVAGYLLFGGHAGRIRVFQIFVAADHRHSRLATKLVDRLRDFGRANRDSVITARVAADLPANAFWRNYGFSLVQQESGSRTSGRTINHYALDLQESLFPLEDLRVEAPAIPPIPESPRPSLQVPTYAIDVNFLVDLVTARHGLAACQDVLHAALANHLRLYVTPELFRELERYVGSQEPDPVRSLAHSFPILPPVQDADLEPLLSSLNSALFPEPKTGRKRRNDRSDTVHLATCIHHGIHGFITRDRRILEHADYLMREHGLEVLTAADIGGGDREAYLPAGGAATTGDGTTLTLSEVSADDQEAIDELFDRLGLSLTQPFRSAFQVVTSRATPRLKSTVVRAHGTLIAIGAWQTTSAQGGSGVRAHLLVDERSAVATTMIDHLLQLTIQSRATPFHTSYLHAHASQLMLLATAQRLGFVVDGSPHDELRVLRKLSINRAVTEASWSDFRLSFERSCAYRLDQAAPSHNEVSNTGIALHFGRPRQSRILSAFEFETAFGPGALAFHGRTGVVVPIRRDYAESLFPEHSRQRTMLPSHEATLRVERAYFMRPGRPVQFRKGDIVIFYVSGARRGPQEAVALARVTFAGVLTVAQAEIMTIRQGVLDEHDIDRRASHGKLYAFTFDNLLSFPFPLPYSQLKELGCVGETNLVTAERLSPDQLQRLIDCAFGEAS